MVLDDHFRSSIDELEKYPSKTGPGVTWGIGLSTPIRNRFKTLKLGNWVVKVLVNLHIKFQAFTSSDIQFVD